jgi:hypothetical protein
VWSDRDGKSFDLVFHNAFDKGYYVVAGEEDPIDRLPTHPQNKESDLYVPVSSAKEGITKSRALKFHWELSSITGHES